MVSLAKLHIKFPPSGSNPSPWHKLVLLPRTKVARSIRVLCHYDWERERIKRVLSYFPGGDKSTSQRYWSWGYGHMADPNHRAGLPEAVDWIQKRIAFLSDPLYRTYTFNYHYGGKMLDAVFEAKGNCNYWFNRLLIKPVTPNQIRDWIENNFQRHSLPLI